MSELEALNMLLRLIGSSPVNDISTNYPDAAGARVALDRIRKQVQRRGWWFNIDYNKTYSPNEDGEILISSAVSTLVPADVRVVLRGDKLYNKVDQSFIFSCDICVLREVRMLDWDDMPDAVQEHCAYLAGAQFVRDEIEDTTKERSLLEDAARTLMDVKKQDLESAQYNILMSRRILRARGGVRPYGLSRGNFGVE